MMVSFAIIFADCVKESRTYISVSYKIRFVELDLFHIFLFIAHTQAFLHTRAEVELR